MKLLEQKKYRTRLEESYKAEKTAEVKRDKEQYAEIPGKYGFVYNYSPTQLAVYVNSLVLKSRLPKAWKVIQNGDFEKTALIPDLDLDRACTLIQAQKKRQYTPEALARLKEHGKNISRKRGSRAN
jgi:hypothetical protein